MTALLPSRKRLFGIPINRRAAVVVLALIFSALYCLAVVPVWLAWIQSTAQLGGAPESLFMAGSFTMFALGLGGFIMLAAISGEGDDLLIIPMLAAVLVIGSLLNTSRAWSSEELGAMQAYNQAQATVSLATQALGSPPPVAARLDVPSLSAAVTNLDSLRDLAAADATPGAVSNALLIIRDTGDDSVHAQFVRDNAMVRPEDQEYFARLLMRSP